jgi:hypothetical protein
VVQWKQRDEPMRTEWLGGQENRIPIKEMVNHRLADLEQTIG